MLFSPGMSNASASTVRPGSIPRPGPCAVPTPPPPRPRIESLSDADFALVEEAKPNVPRPAARPKSTPPPMSQRVPTQDLIPVLFDRIHDLELLGDALEGAEYVLDVLAKTIPTRSALVHLYDSSKRSFVVATAKGEAKDSMILSRQDARDPLIRLLMPGGRPFSWTNLRNVSVSGIARFAELGHMSAVMAAPVSIGPRWMGVLELVDPVNGDAFRSADENALAYIADRYAAFLSTRGVIVDVATIARFALNG